MNPGLTKTFTADTAIAAYRIVKHGSGDTAVVQAVAVSDSLLGVTGQVLGEVGKRVDVVMSDTAEVEYGGAITRGDWLTSDANGKAVTAAPAAGVNNNVIGRAMCSGVLGDIGSVMLMGTRIQG
jgi:hypothetical protein